LQKQRLTIYSIDRRLGAGKSTLMTALMRLVELDDGAILIDGVDTSQLGLRRLRSSIAVIPQDPVLFSGSVKTNLDPFDNHTEHRLMAVLERVGLFSQDSPWAIQSLDDNILQDGENLSVGQRQLLVIARALLDGAGIVICDEATASIDAEADARIQKVLRTDFADATTLTVAHRLNTIMDSTHILVMSDGKAVEFDTPSKLLAKGGFFKDLVDKWEEENEANL
jgi:ATP-binding cassette subfamily C (CFTR/MRP) protein 1